MKHLVWKLVLPLTIISFSVFTKWWYVLPVDAPDTVMSGFPLIWISEGWHTSMSFQIFVSELFFNLFIYFLFWYVLIFSVNKFIIEIMIPKFLLVIILLLSGTFITGYLWIGTMPEHVFKVKRDFDCEVLDSGYKFIWTNQDRPKYESYK